MKEININWWAKDDWYFIPTFNLHVEYRCFSFYFRINLLNQNKDE